MRCACCYHIVAGKRNTAPLLSHPSSLEPLATSSVREKQCCEERAQKAGPKGSEIMGLLEG